ncbi:MAG: hypothetical protein ACOX3V_01830 [Bacillota bacterium]|jgi:hypothetical protein
MRQLDKDLAWVITFTSFLVFLLSAIACSFLDAVPQRVPTPVALAKASLNIAFLDVLAGFVRLLSIGAIIVGVYGIIFWPHNRNA